MWYVQVRALLHVSTQVESPSGTQRKPLEFRVSEENLVCWRGRGSLDDQPRVSLPQLLDRKRCGKQRFHLAGAAPHALSMPLLSKLRAAARCENVASSGHFTLKHTKEAEEWRKRCPLQKTGEGAPARARPESMLLLLLLLLSRFSRVRLCATPETAAH